MDIYGLIGKKLGHSFSADFFNQKFKLENTDAEYLNFELKSIIEIEKILSDNPNIKGLNVTIPYKESIISYLDELSASAKAVGAVNTIQFTDGKLIGHNTDVTGFEKSLKPLLKEYHKKALVLGTGGASKAVVYVLSKLGIPFQLVARNESDNNISYRSITSNIINEHLLIINTTPLGMWPDTDSSPDIPYQILEQKHLLYDLVYNPEETLFLKKGQSRGAHIKNGKEMLELQALAAWKIWGK